MSSFIVEYTRTYNIENRRATFLESNEAARLYLLHLLLGKSWSFSEIGLSVYRIWKLDMHLDHLSTKFKNTKM